jgi:hypothetical protein
MGIWLIQLDLRKRTIPNVELKMDYRIESKSFKGFSNLVDKEVS